MNSKCCNLNASVPTGVREDEGKGLPVKVWFHGGSFMLGSASWPQYGMQKMTIGTSDDGRFREIRKVVSEAGITGYWSLCQLFLFSSQLT